jgi:hypothetical protein
MNTKLSLLSRAATVAGILAVASLPALAQTATPAPASPAPSAATTQVAPPVAKTGTVDHKTKKDKTVATKKHDSMMKTAKSDTGHKPAPVKPEAPASSNAGK